MTVGPIADVFALKPKKNDGPKATQLGAPEGRKVLRLKDQVKSASNAPSAADKEKCIRKDNKEDLSKLIQEVPPDNEKKGQYCSSDGKNAAGIAFSVIDLMVLEPSEARKAQAENVTSLAVSMLL